MTRGRARWLTFSAHVQGVLWALFGFVAFAAALGAIWVCAIGESSPTLLLYVPIFLWLAANWGLGFGAICWYRKDILRAFDSGDLVLAQKLSNVGTVVSFGMASDLQIEDLPPTWAVRAFERLEHRLWLVGLGCAALAVALELL